MVIRFFMEAPLVRTFGGTVALALPDCHWLDTAAARSIPRSAQFGRLQGEGPSDGVGRDGRWRPCCDCDARHRTPHRLDDDPGLRLGSWRALRVALATLGDGRARS